MDQELYEDEEHPGHQLPSALAEFKIFSVFQLSGMFLWFQCGWLHIRSDERVITTNPHGHQFILALCNPRYRKGNFNQKTKICGKLCSLSRSASPLHFKCRSSLAVETTTKLRLLQWKIPVLPPFFGIEAFQSCTHSDSCCSTPVYSKYQQKSIVRFTHLHIYVLD